MSGELLKHAEQGRDMYELCADAQHLEAMVNTGEWLGLHGIGFCAPPAEEALAAVGERLEAIDTDLELLSVLQLGDAHAGNIGSLMGQFSDRVDLVAIRGTTLANNRQFINAKGIDLLVIDLTRKGDPFDHVLVKEAAERGIVLAPDLSALFESGKGRVYALDTLETLLRFSTHHDARVIPTTCPDTPFALRHPRNLAACFALAREGKQTRVEMYETWLEAIVGRARERKREGYVRSGVRRDET